MSDRVKIETIYGFSSLRPVSAPVIVMDGGDAPWWQGLLSVEFVIWVFLFAVVAGVLWALLADSRRPTFTLKKNDWACTASHQESVTTYVNMGSGQNIVLMPITTSHTVCDQWGRK